MNPDFCMQNLLQRENSTSVPRYLSGGTTGVVQMHYSLAETDEIRRWRKHLIWAFVTLALAAGVHLFASIGEAFLAGVSEQPNAVSISLVGAVYLWAAFIAYRLAKALDPRFYYYWTITALMFLPVVNLIAIISLFMGAGRALAGPKPYK